MAMPTPAELQTAWEEVQKVHREYLAVHKVVLPKANHYSENHKAVWLAVLWINKDRDTLISKNEISKVVQRDIKGAAPDQQVRHLKRDGWDIGPESGLHRLSPYNPSQEYQNQSAKKRSKLEANTFDELKAAFGYKCATCGAKEGQPDPRYGATPVKLQQGHLDPQEGGNAKQNIIPQCQHCNQAYKDDFTFDDKGRVRAVASINPVKRATRSVQKRIFDYLKNYF